MKPEADERGNALRFGRWEGVSACRQARWGTGCY